MSELQILSFSLLTGKETMVTKFKYISVTEL